MKLKEISQIVEKCGAEEVGFLKAGNQGFFPGWAGGILIIGLSIRDPFLTKGVRYPGWSEPRQFIDVLLNDISLKICEHLREKGVKTEVIDAASPEIDIRPLALKAGLGTQGKNGLIINERFGPRIRFGGLFVDIDIETRDKTLKEFCSGCDICLEGCPVGAISDGIDVQKCYSYNLKLERENGPIFKKCTRCTDICPVGSEEGL